MKTFRITLFFLMISAYLPATPLSVFWTYATTDIQPTGVLKLNVNDYFSVQNRRFMGQRFPTDIGLTYGLFDWQGLKSEVGLDYFGGTDDPWYFNGKFGIAQDLIYKNSPAFAVGIYYVGTRTKTILSPHWDVLVSPQTNQNILYGNISYTFSNDISLYAGVYNLNKYFGEPRGIQVGAAYNTLKTTYYDNREYFRLIWEADWASGDNILGGGGAGIEYFFTPDIWIQTGAVFFNTARFNGSWKWTMQCNFDIPLWET